MNPQQPIPQQPPIGPSPDMPQQPIIQPQLQTQPAIQPQQLMQPQPYSQPEATPVQPQPTQTFGQPPQSSSAQGMMQGGQVFQQPMQPQQSQSQPMFMSDVPQQQGQPMPGQAYRSHGARLPFGKNKKKLAMIVAAAIVIIGAGFLLLGGAKEVVNKISGIELENYTSTNFAFSMDVPKGWKTEEKNEEYLKEVSFEEPVGDLEDTDEAAKYFAAVRVSYEFADKEYMESEEQDYFDNLRKGIKQTLDRQAEKQSSESASDSSYAEEVPELDSEEMVTVNGLKALKVKLKVTNHGGNKGELGYEYALFVFVDKKTQYEITMSAHESEGLNAKADGIMNSFVKK